MADTSTFRTACQLADHLHRPAQGKKAVEAMIADIQAALTVRTDFLLDGEHPLGEGRLQRPAVTHRSHPWLTGRAPLLYTLSPAAPLALYRAVVFFRLTAGRGACYPASHLLVRQLPAASCPPTLFGATHASSC